MKHTAYLTALLLTGCAAPGYFVHESHSAAQFERDKRECEYEAYRAEPLSPIVRANIAVKCLEARGYVWKQGELPKP